MSRWARRVDANQEDVVADLRARGCCVIHTFRHGEGAPDFIASHPARPGVNVMVELKNPKRPKSADAKHKARQAETRAAWPGLYIQATTADEVFDVLLRPLA